MNIFLIHAKRERVVMADIVKNGFWELFSDKQVHSLYSRALAAQGINPLDIDLFLATPEEELVNHLLAYINTPIGMKIMMEIFYGNYLDFDGMINNAVSVPGRVNLPTATIHPLHKKHQKEPTINFNEEQKKLLIEINAALEKIIVKQNLRKEGKKSWEIVKTKGTKKLAQSRANKELNAKMVEDIKSNFWTKLLPCQLNALSAKAIAAQGMDPLDVNAVIPTDNDVIIAWVNDYVATPIGMKNLERIYGGDYFSMEWVTKQILFEPKSSLPTATIHKFNQA